MHGRYNRASWQKEAAEKQQTSVIGVQGGQRRKGKAPRVK